MSIEAIASIGTGLETSELQLTNGATQAGFGEHIRAEFMALNDKIGSAEAALKGLATGEQQNIHHVMLTLEDARMSFQLLAQVRNKVLDAYQEIMRMQV